MWIGASGLVSAAKRVVRQLPSEAAKLDKAAAVVAGQWRAFHKKYPRRDLADFVRLFNPALPDAFDDFWDDATFQAVNYLLARAGAVPRLPIKRLKKRKAAKKR